MQTAQGKTQTVGCSSQTQRKNTHSETIIPISQNTLIKGEVTNVRDNFSGGGVGGYCRVPEQHPLR